MRPLGRSGKAPVKGREGPVAAPNSACPKDEEAEVRCESAIADAMGGDRPRHGRKIIRSTDKLIIEFIRRYISRRIAIYCCRYENDQTINDTTCHSVGDFVAIIDACTMFVALASQAWVIYATGETNPTGQGGLSPVEPLWRDDEREPKPAHEYDGDLRRGRRWAGCDRCGGARRRCRSRIAG